MEEDFVEIVGMQKKLQGINQPSYKQGLEGNTLTEP